LSHAGRATSQTAKPTTVLAAKLGLGAVRSRLSIGDLPSATDVRRLLRARLQMPPSPEYRSRTMASVGGKNTKPELTVRRALHAAGFRFRIHCNSLPGKPDIVLPQYRVAVMVHGCFWHGHDCRKGLTLPKTNREFWHTKLARNKQRDQEDRSALEKAGWYVHNVWECDIDNAIDGIIADLENRRQGRAPGRDRNTSHGGCPSSDAPVPHQQALGQADALLVPR
jgi:DNA mismatch endonuclease, patch repair protein